MAHTQQALTHKGCKHFSRFRVLEQRVCSAEKTGVVIFWNNVIYFRFVLEKKQFWPIQISSLEKMILQKCCLPATLSCFPSSVAKSLAAAPEFPSFISFLFFSASALLMWRTIRCRNIGNLMEDPKETVCPAHQLLSVVTRVHCHYAIVLTLLYWQLKLHCWPDLFLSGVKVFLMVFLFFIID